MRLESFRCGAGNSGRGPSHRAKPLSVSSRGRVRGRALFSFVIVVRDVNTFTDLIFASFARVLGGFSTIDL